MLFDKSDEGAPQGRSKSINAFVINLAATAAVFAATFRGRLRSFAGLSVIEQLIVAGAAPLFCAYVWHLFRRSPSS